MRAVRATIRILLFLVHCAIWIPVQAIILLVTRGPASLVLPLYWHKALRALFGIRVTVIGAPARDGQTLFAANHLSYLDITTLSGIIPVSFIAKAEVARWPLFGTLARLQQTAFTSRSRTQAGQDRAALEWMVGSGKSLILFAEGTSSDGSRILPFKSAFFSIAQPETGPALNVQPVTIRLRAVDGQPADSQDIRDLYAWHGDMVMAPHLLRFAGLRGADLEVIFHPALSGGAFEGRKQLARQAENAVRHGLLSGMPLQDWHKTEDDDTVRNIKENDDELFDPGREPAASLSAEQIRQ